MSMLEMLSDDQFLSVKVRWNSSGRNNSISINTTTCGGKKSRSLSWS